MADLEGGGRRRRESVRSPSEAILVRSRSRKGGRGAEWLSRATDWLAAVLTDVVDVAAAGGGWRLRENGKRSLLDEAVEAAEGELVIDGYTLERSAWAGVAGACPERMESPRR